VFACTGSPIILTIANPASKLALTNGNATRYVQSGQPFVAIVSPRGFPINPRDFSATVTGEQSIMCSSVIFLPLQLSSFRNKLSLVLLY